MMFFHFFLVEQERNNKKVTRDLSAMVKFIDILKLGKSLEMQKLEQLQHVISSIHRQQTQQRQTEVNLV